MSDLSKKLLDNNYIPVESEDSSFVQKLDFQKIIKCPVRFTEDPLEYAESKEFMGYKLRPFQKGMLIDMFTIEKPYAEAVMIAGMRSGKSIGGALVGSFLLHKLLALDNPGLDMGQAPNQKFSGEFIATSEQQSKQTAYSSFENILTGTPWWRKYIAYLLDRETKEGKETLYQHHVKKVYFPSKNLEVLSLHSNSSSIAGLTAFFVCFDEMSRFDVGESEIQQKSEKRTAQAVYYTAARAAKTLKGFSKIVTITSPMYETDFGMQLLYMADKVKGGAGVKVIDTLRLRYDKRVVNIIGYHYSTFEANPFHEIDNPSGFVEDDFKAEQVANYATYMRDYLALPPSAISPFFDLPERLDKSVNHDRDPLVTFNDELLSETVGQETRYYMGKTVNIVNANKLNKYFVCCDQAAVSDSFAVAMGHAEMAELELPDAHGKLVKTSKSKIIINFVEDWIPDKKEKITVSFTNVEEVIRILNNSFYIDRVIYDSWHSTESIERLFSEGVMTDKLGATLEMYETMKLLVYSGMVELPDNELLLTELRQLNIIKGKKIDHPSNGSKDLADAVVRVVWCVYIDSIRDAIHGNFMLPVVEKVPTVRSVGLAYATEMQNSMSDTPHYGIFGTSSGGGGSVFGKSTIVRPNVVPNIESKFK